MEAFNEIRRHAKQKRDKAIQRARDEYAETLRRIAVVEQDITGREATATTGLAACVHRALPTDRPFTSTDIVHTLEAMDPGRVWLKRSVDRRIQRLRVAGVVKRLKRCKAGEPALYVRVGVQTGPMPFEGKPLPEVVAEVLGDRSMTLTELVVAMLEAGYQTKMGRKSLRDRVGMALREKKRFRRENGKWMATIDS